MNINSLFDAIKATIIILSLLMPISSFAQDALLLDQNGFVGIGATVPQRQLHVLGRNAAFRLDRDVNGAGFVLVRTALGNFDNIWKAFSFNARASGPNNGDFVINDLGTATGGGGTTRMTITNDGDIIIGGNVTAKEYFTSSSQRYKENIQTITGSIESIRHLRGVTFNWKDTGAPSIGLIAEEVQATLPSLVEIKEGEPIGVNYQALVGLIIEAVKEQEHEIKNNLELITAQNDRIKELEDKVASYKSMAARLSTVEEMLRSQPMPVKLTIKD